jgi:hypothetical protein
VHFNLERLLSMAGRREQALENLARSVGVYARSEPDFDPIRDDPRFSAIVGSP